jgi:hypothetical protein
LILHPIGPVARTNLYNMVLILLSVIFAAIIAAISMIRHHVFFGSFSRAEIARENAKELAEQSRVTGPIKQFLVVVLPDGRVVNSMVAEQL